jgi:hypothetical protein
MGIVVRARRAKWGFYPNKHARLAFAFTYTTASNGDLVRLRGLTSRREDDRVVIDRERFHHDFQWAGAADTFEAYVDGSPDIKILSPITAATRER